MAVRRDLPWALVALCAASWAVLALWSGSGLARWLHHDYQPTGPAGQLAALAAYSLGWALMTLAMMTPSAGALLGSFQHVVHSRTHANTASLALMAGFLGVWVATGCAFRALDGGLHAAVDQIAWLRAHPELIAAAGLLVAGAFQFTPAKRRCLTACRSPQNFIYRHWGRGGAGRDAFAIGAAYGASCVGCCWALMLVIFASSMASFALMLAFTAIMAAERAQRIGERLIRPLGLGLLAAAVVVAV